MSRRRVGRALVSIAALLLSVFTVGNVAAAVSTRYPLADPDTLLLPDGTYVTYGTTVGAVGVCGGVRTLNVPYFLHGRGTSITMNLCPTEDAMPNGPGAWADPRGGIWAPSVIRYNSIYYMYYTATKAGTSQKCVGLAKSASPRGPFNNGREWACPPSSRWALDPDAFVYQGTIYVVYRDDALTTGADTGLSAVAANADGWAIWSSRRTLLLSTDILWDTTNMWPGSARVVENPSMFKQDGKWWIAYSGNNWDSPRYATGIAECAAPLPTSRCVPHQNGVNRPYFGYIGSSGLGPFRGMPGNHAGPGGMSVFQDSTGANRVVWHWWAGLGNRYTTNGTIRTDTTGFYITD